MHGAVVQSFQNIQRPRHQQPDNGTFFLGDSLQNGLRIYALEQNRAAAGQQTAEPVHLCTSVIERRNTQENVLFRLVMVILLHLARMHQALVRVQNCLRESGRSG